MKRLLILAALFCPLAASEQLPGFDQWLSCEELKADKSRLHGEYKQLEQDMLTQQARIKKMTDAINSGILSATGYNTWGRAKEIAYRQVLQWQKLESRRLALEERAKQLEQKHYRDGCAKWP